MQKKRQQLNCNQIALLEAAPSKEAGFVMWEMLCVIAVISGLSLFVIGHFRDAWQDIQLQQLQQDLAIILQALNNYYHQQACLKGLFPIDQNTDLMSNPSWLPEELHKEALQLHYPAGVAYRAYVKPTGQYSQMRNRPIYRFQIQAEFNQSSLSEARLTHYQNALDAQLRNGHTLLWSYPPQQMSAQFGSALWGLGWAREEFRDRARYSEDTHC